MNRHRLLYSFMVLFYLCGTHFALSQTPFWQPTNGPEGGDIRSLVMNSDGDLFAATTRGGIFLSTDSGASWAPINDGFAFPGTHQVGLGALAYNPATHSVFAANGCYIWRTIDKGQNWALTNLDPSVFGCGDGIIAIRGDGSIFIYTNDNGVVRSQDDGQSWQIVGAGQVLPRVTSLAFNEVGNIIAGTHAGVYESFDSGESWVIVPGSEEFEVVTLGVDTFDNHIHVGTYGYSPQEGSTFCYDGGIWIETPRSGWVGNEYWGFHQAAVFGFYGGAVFLGAYQDSGVFRSLDHGRTWQYIGLGQYGDPEGQRTVPAMVISSAGDVFAGTCGDGVFKWSGSGKAWTRLAHGMRATDVHSLIVAHDGGVLAGTATAGIFRTANSGESWARVNSALVGDTTEISCLAVDSFGRIFAAWGGVSVSVDGGITWPSPSDHTLPGCCAFTLAIDRSNAIYAGGGSGAFRSRDNGLTWDFLPGLENKDIRSMAVNSAGHIFAGGLNTGLWRSVDEGNTWIPIAGFEGTYYIQSIAINPDGDVFVSGHSNGVMCSFDNGETWDLVYPSQASVIAVNSEGTVFAGLGGGGVVSSTDNGNTWREVNDGLMNLWILSFAFDADGYLYSGHWGGGVSRTTETTFLKVPYTFEGFFSPMENDPVVNRAKAGQAIPVKWRITDKDGLPISDPASFVSITSYNVSCASFEGDPTNSVEEVAAGSSGLQYMGDGWWQFNWKTPKSYAGQCRIMKLTLDDKSEHTAGFSFK